MNSIELIKAERLRQINEEGWTAENDDEYVNHELAAAAASYLLTPMYSTKIQVGRELPPHWPWLARWWKPNRDERILELIKAGALIAAEIDRLSRKEHLSTESIVEKKRQLREDKKKMRFFGKRH